MSATSAAAAADELQRNLPTADNDIDGLDLDGDDYEEQEEDIELDGAPAAPSQQDISFKKLYESHPECMLDYIESVVPRIPLTVAPAGPRADKTQQDPNHTTYPFLTRFEITKIIGHRSNELSLGARPYIAVPEHITDVRDIARMELEQKRLPYIIKRPLPTGKYEYWRLADLLILPS